MNYRINSGPKILRSYFLHCECSVILMQRPDNCHVVNWHTAVMYIWWNILQKCFEILFENFKVFRKWFGVFRSCLECECECAYLLDEFSNCFFSVILHARIWMVLSTYIRTFLCTDFLLVVTHTPSCAHICICTSISCTCMYVLCTCVGNKMFKSISRLPVARSITRTLAHIPAHKCTQCCDLCRNACMQVTWSESVQCWMSWTQGS